MNNKDFFPFERNRYFYGKMLTARDFETEQKYQNDKRRLVNRTVLGSGIICGLGVNCGDDSSLTIESGLAIDYLGREIAVSSPVFQKFAMLPGSEKLEGFETAYLCLAYKETGSEPVSNIGVATSDEQYNKVEEGFTLFLDTGQPDYNTLYGEGGLNTVSVVYSRRDIDIVQVMPVAVIAGEAFVIKYIIVKNLALPPISFSMEFSSDYIKDINGGDDLHFSYRENIEAKKHVTVAEYKVKAVQMPGVRAHYANGKPKLSLECGDFSGQGELHQVSDIQICKDKAELIEIRRFRMSNLNSRMYGGETPIYLAKIDFATVGKIHMFRNVTPHPFEQRLGGRDPSSTSAVQHVSDASGGAIMVMPEVVTEVETLKYWQKPEVTSEFTDDKLFFRFGMPSTEAYDYATSSGVVEIPITGTIRVNVRFISGEIQHLLGLGNVSINLSVAYGSGGNERLLFGNGEVFSGKNMDKDIPKVQAAAILYPDRGTFQVGVWCLDHVDGQSIKIHWFAMKTSRDTAEIRAADKVSVKITPEIHKAKIRKTVHFKATVTGSSDKEVIWSLAEANSGTIDQNGAYKAPSTPGTYEINARSSADPSAQTSAFVIVED